jgi:hypothetical protein
MSSAVGLAGPSSLCGSKAPLRAIFPLAGRFTLRAAKPGAWGAARPVTMPDAPDRYLLTAIDELHDLAFGSPAAGGLSFTSPVRTAVRSFQHRSNTLEREDPDDGSAHQCGVAGRISPDRLNLGAEQMTALQALCSRNQKKSIHSLARSLRSGPELLKGWRSGRVDLEEAEVPKKKPQGLRSAAKKTGKA